MSGFDYTFVSQVPAEYMCLICQCAMRKPVQTRCGHRFCKHCLQQSMTRSQECPIDRNHLDESRAKDIYPDVASERTILDFQVKCPNRCVWIGELRSVEDHIKSICPRTIVNCTFAHIGCQVKVQRNALSQHEKANTETHLNLSCKKLQELQASSSTGQFIWKFTEFEQRLKKAKDDIQKSFYSDSFYTGPYGYKMHVEIFPNGNGDGENTHLSVFMCLERGDYDAILAWPFNQMVVFTLVDQQADQTQRKDKQMSIVPGDETDASEYFVRPTSEQNDGFGFSDFISHDDLRTRRYLVDDTLFIQVKVEQDSA